MQHNKASAARTQPTYRALGDGSLEVAAFPSYAAPALSQSIGAGVMADLSVVNVKVDEECFAEPQMDWSSNAGVHVL